MNPITLTLIVTVIATFLAISGMLRIVDAGGTDPETSGRWGFFEYRKLRKRKLSTHEQRWQTDLFQAMNDDFHWQELLLMVDGLDAQAGLEPPSAPAPVKANTKYLDQRIARLDAHVASTDTEPRRQK